MDEGGERLVHCEHKPQRKKLKFSETEWSFVVKVRLFTFVFIFLCKLKLWQELRTRHTFDRCEAL